MKQTKPSFTRITMDEASRDTPIGRRWADRAGEEERPREGHYRDGKKRLHISAKKGKALHACSSMSAQYVCCATRVLRNMSNCPMHCSYCFLQNYLTNTTTSVVADIDALVEEVREEIVRHPGRFLRVGTWELADSLILEEELGNSSALVEAFAPLKGALLELRTKSSVVGPLLGLSHGGRTVASWSMNPPAVIRSDEHGTASFEERLAAMVRVMEDGYLLALHFDPMIWHEGWEQNYVDMVHEIFRRIDPDRVAWISMGVLRFNPEMKRKMAENFPGSRLTTAELVTGNDGKMRYVKPLRRAMLSLLYSTVRQCAGDDPYIYLCMEKADMWQKVAADAGQRRPVPADTAALEYEMAASLYRRFPGLMDAEPRRENFTSPPDGFNRNVDRRPTETTGPLP